MNPWLVPLGLLVVSAAIADVVGSLLGDSGNGGWATGPAGRLAWRALAPSRRRQSHGLSHLLGRLIVLAPPLAWLMGRPSTSAAPPCSPSVAASFNQSAAGGSSPP
jgi:hypothetical protein